MKSSLAARLTAEFLGAAFLVAAVIGSGIMGERLSGGNVAIALLANTIATGAALVALILTFGPISGAHLNPAVTLSVAIEHGISWPEAFAYIAAQCAGALAGAVIAHLMFGLPWYSFSAHARQGPAQFLSEFVATFGLVSVIWGCSRRNPAAVPYAVVSYITAAYWFTASTSFANPAVTIARAFSDTFARHPPARRSPLHRSATNGSPRRDDRLPLARSDSEPTRLARLPQLLPDLHQGLLFRGVGTRV
jgi:glycerol uptake facilitator-like aquaporin